MANDTCPACNREFGVADGDCDWCDPTAEQVEAILTDGRPVFLTGPPCGCRLVEATPGIRMQCGHGTYLTAAGELHQHLARAKERLAQAGPPVPDDMDAIQRMLNDVEPHEYVGGLPPCWDCMRPADDPIHASEPSAGVGPDEGEGE